MIVVPNASSVDLQSSAIYKKMRFDVACRPFVRTVLVPSEAITQAVESKGEAGARLGLNILDNVRGPSCLWSPISFGGRDRVVLRGCLTVDFNGDGNTEDVDDRHDGVLAVVEYGPKPSSESR